MFENVFRERQTGIPEYLREQVDYVWLDLVGWVAVSCRGRLGCGVRTRERWGGKPCSVLSMLDGYGLRNLISC